MKVLLTGTTGQVGWELQRSLCTLGQVIAVDSRQLNLADPDAIVSQVRAVQPDLIVNPAAYTAVDKAESEAELAFAINGTAPGILAEEARRLGVPLVHYSTDYVFDGSKQGAYVETDPTNPLSVYGRSKLAGEQAIQAVGGSHLILRTSWVYGLRGKNFLLTMQRLLRERSELKVVGDQWGAATWSRYIADATAALLRREGLVQDGREVIHVAASSFWCWYDFTVAIRGHLEAQGVGPLAQVLAIPSSAYPTPVKRPENSRLDTAKLHGLGVSAPSSEAMLALALAV